jgi:glycosyltransferase involved in cell wall biosynthesis
MYGGPVTAIMGMTAALGRAGLDVRVMTTDYRSKGMLEKLQCEARAFPCVFGPWKWSPTLARALKDEVRWADVVNIHTLWTHPVAAAAWTAHAAGVPYVLRPAGMLDPWSLSQKRLKKKIYGALIENQIIRRSAALWFTSEDERSRATTTHQQSQSFVIPLGVADEEYNEPNTGIFRKRFPDSSNARIILFLGRLARKKRPDVLLRAFASLAGDFPDSILVLAGPDELGNVGEMKRLAESLKIANRVHFPGDLTHAEVVGAMHDAEVFVLPSLHENFGMSVIEAMASGTPVIITERVALCSLVEQEKSGLVIKPSLEALTSALRYLLMNSKLGREMGLRGRQIALKRFTWDAIAPQIIEMYNRVAGAKQQYLKSA